MRLWNADTGAPILLLRLEERGIMGATWNSDESQVLTWSYGRATVWDGKTGDVLFILEHSPITTWVASWSPAEDRILTASQERIVSIWDAKTGSKLLDLNYIGRDEGLQATWNKDGKRVLGWSFTNKAVMVWDADNGDLLQTMNHDGNLWSASWNADESRILTCGRDGLIKIWQSPA